MLITQFPILSQPPSYPASRSIKSKTLKSTSESGMVMTRPAYTRNRKSFKFSYEHLTEADVTLVEDHYQLVRGGAMAFKFINPVNDVEYLVRYDGDEIQIDDSDYENIKITIVLVEA